MTTDPAVLGSLIAGKRILWLDPNDDLSDVDDGYRALEEAARQVGGRTAIVQVKAVDEALDLLRRRHWDLLITHWGHGQAAPPYRSVGAELLAELHLANTTIPVVVFAGGDHADENKVDALARGAIDFTFTWDGLFAAIGHVFAPGSATG